MLVWLPTQDCLCFEQLTPAPSSRTPRITNKEPFHSQWDSVIWWPKLHCLKDRNIFSSRSVAQVFGRPGLTSPFGRSGHVTHSCAYGFLTKGGEIEDSRSLLKLLLCCTNLLSGALLSGKGWGRKARMGTSWLQRVFIDSIWVPNQRMSAKAKRWWVQQI